MVEGILSFYEDQVTFIGCLFNNYVLKNYFSKAEWGRPKANWAKHVLVLWRKSIICSTLLSGHFGKSGHLPRFEMALKHCVIYFEIPISASQIFRGKKTFKMGKWLWHQRDFLPRRKPGKRVAWRGKAGARKAHFKVNYRGNPARRILTFASQVSSKVNVWVKVINFWRVHWMYF